MELRIEEIDEIWNFSENTLKVYRLEEISLERFMGEKPEKHMFRAYLILTMGSGLFVCKEGGNVPRTIIGDTVYTLRNDI